MKNELKILALVAVCITWLVSLALLMGQDGVIFQAGITALGATGILGYLRRRHLG